MTTAATIPSVTKSRFISVSSAARGKNPTALPNDEKIARRADQFLNGPRIDRLNFERQPIHFSHAHSRALRNRLTGRSGGAPQFAVDANHSGDLAFARRGFDRLGDFAL